MGFPVPAVFFMLMTVSSFFSCYRDWFLWGMVLAVALAWLFPGPGAPGGWMQPHLLTKGGVALVFFLHGLSLSLESIRQGAMQWKLHAVIQGMTFALFPLIGLGLLSAPLPGLGPELKIGFFFLCALPSTVSSSVAMTALARGNVPVAVFNATLSSLIGIVLTPLWLRLAAESMSSNGAMMPFGEVLVDLVCWLLLPLVLGQLLRPVLGAWALRHKAIVGKVDRVMILLLVYTSFCDSVRRGVWDLFGIGTMVSVAVLCLLLFCTVFAFAAGACRVLGIERQDRSAVIFCGSKKSLAQGVPMAQLIFAGNPALGVILVPMMLYHPLQLVIGGVLASRWGSRSTTGEAI